MSEGLSQSNRVSVIVPAYNEERTIARVLTRLRECVADLHEIVVVDDGSRDGTCQAVEKLGYANVRLVRQERNQGKTAAVRRGLREVTGTITVIQDADLEYDPSDLDECLAPIREGRADVVYGSRFMVRRAARVLYFYHYVANKFLTFLSNCLTNTNMSDIETCYKLFRTPLVQTMPITSSGFGMEVEITATITKTRARIYEVPISYYGRTYEEGKKIGASDGVAALWYILYYNLAGHFSPARRRYVLEANRFLEKQADRV
jgi:glycosyltransferase involved in cell wall biosynthesis